MRSFAMKAAVVGIAALWLAGCSTLLGEPPRG